MIWCELGPQYAYRVRIKIETSLGQKLLNGCKATDACGERGDARAQILLSETHATWAASGGKEVKF